VELPKSIPKKNIKSEYSIQEAITGIDANKIVTQKSNNILILI